MISQQFIRPERLLVGTFAALCLASTFMLWLPGATPSSHAPKLLDLAFTAVSAVCVTGLTVLDTPSAFTGWGQVLLLLSIQVGGLGVMTFSSLALTLLGRRLSLHHEGVLASIVGAQSRFNLAATLRQLVVVALAIEAGGTLVLFACFLSTDDSVGMAAWRALFTSVSAYCNAGFALQSDNLIPYQTHPLVLDTVSLLIISGGFSPLALVGVTRRLRGNRRALPLQTMLAGTTTVALLGLGAAVVIVGEWNDELAALSFWDKLHNAWFYSATLRTAGFNSFPLDDLHPGLWLVSVIWMVIGGSPGGTAGGIKTTTLAVLVLMMLQGLRSDSQVTAFRKAVSAPSTQRAVAVASIALFGLMIATMALLMSQDLPIHVAVFEAASALGTVGLTIGGTPALDATGKVIIIICMFVGRVGGLSLLFLLSRQASALPRRRFPEEEVTAG